MVVFDEVHFGKQASQESESQRRATLRGIRAQVREHHPNAMVLGMSATPVVNNLKEAVSLLELVEGVELNDLSTRPTVRNANLIYQHTIRHGVRQMPRYATQLRAVPAEVDAPGLLADLLDLPHGAHAAQLDRLLLPSKLNTIATAALAARARGKKALVYTEFVDGMVDPIREHLESLGLRVGEHTGRNKTGLDGFLHTGADVLVGSSAVSTGIDGLQDVADTVVFASLPWTHAAYEQVIGRLHRTGQKAATVYVVVPRVRVDVGDDEAWSWDAQRMARVMFKKSLADAAVDGVVPELELESAQSATDNALEGLRRRAERARAEWVARLESGDERRVERRPLEGHLGAA